LSRPGNENLCEAFRGGVVNGGTEVDPLAELADLLWPFVPGADDGAVSDGWGASTLGFDSGAAPAVGSTA
jgi:hypothetical protein